MKNTRIQPVLLWVLPSGVGVYLSPFKDVGGSRIIFAGPSKFFTEANKDQQRQTIHAVYSIRKDYLDKSVETNIIAEFRSESFSKVKISHHMSCSKSGRKDVIKATDLISSGTSAELARLMVSAYFNRKYNTVNNRKVRLGSVTKIDKFQDLLIVCILFIFLYFSTCALCS